ncbi:serine O-acetyltransferase [Vibrio vulnificus]|uniref:serine O-acetyltransferase n=1 Tax=Vibrio vulnificus TaxID=672 RepID=UPI001CDB97B2|nr:serine acetyltransferase [Vibrio vulnificus]MCA3894941.1 serine acetyltransferase [Vibrio vulnificus]
MFKEEVLKKLKLDLESNFPGKDRFLLSFFLNPKLRCLILFRLYENYKAKANNFFNRFGLKIIRFIYDSSQRKIGMELPLGTRIGGGYYIPHPNGIVVNAKAKVGDNCTILQQVTIGGDSRKENGKPPTIGNDVVLSAGCKVIGPIQVGNNVIVGANAVLIQNALSDSIYAGVPAKLKTKLR